MNGKGAESGLPKLKAGGRTLTLDHNRYINSSIRLKHELHDIEKSGGFSAIKPTGISE